MCTRDQLLADGPRCARRPRRQHRQRALIVDLIELLLQRQQGEREDAHHQHPHNELPTCFELVGLHSERTLLPARALRDQLVQRVAIQLDDIEIFRRVGVHTAGAIFHHDLFV